MLFHVGALWRLNEFGQLSKMTHISSVSGGSIVAGVLAANWSHLDFDADGKAQAFNQCGVEPLTRLARKSIDYPAAAFGLVLPFVSAAGLLARAYNKHVTSRKTLADIPASPRFIFNATNVQTRAVWTFQKDMMGDPIVGWQKPEVSLATAVAASSAFPPVLSPLTLEFPHSIWKPFPHNSGALRYYDDLRVRVERVRPDHLETLRKRVVLADGGIADNLGLLGLPPTQGNRYISEELEIAKLSSIGTKLRAMDDRTNMRLINWGYVAANRSLPYVSGLWKTRDGSEFHERSLPYPRAGFG